MDKRMKTAPSDGAPMKPMDVKLIGYWRNESDPSWPDPAWFVDEQWDVNARQLVADYLRAGTVYCVACGVSWCRFRCGVSGVGSAEQTDGVYVWPEGLAHYVEQHSVRLPDKFVRHATTSQPDPSLSTIVFGPANFSADFAWWKNQIGWTTNSSFLRPAWDGVLWLEPVEFALPTVKQIMFLRRFTALMNIGAVQITELLRKRERIELEKKFDYATYVAMRAHALELHLDLTFEEPPYRHR
jgi:hypothetical protein